MKKLKAVMTALLFPGLLWAGAVPPTITYQGTIKQQGVPVNGTIPLSFRLTNSDGTQVYWSGSSTPVAVNQGMFSSNLSPTGVDWQNVVPYIEMSVNGQTLLPREPLGTGAYAFMSNAVVDGSITTASLAAGAVTTATMANGSVTTAQIAPSAVTTPLIAAGAVTTVQMAAGAITTPAIANGAVTTAQLANASVTTNQLAPNAVTLPTLGADAQGFLVPSGMVAIFTSACPGGWTRLAALDNAFPMGGSAYGASGGSATHSHTLGAPTVTSTAVAFTSGQGSGSTWINFATDTHSHSVSTESNIPPYITVIYCQKN